MDEPPIGRLWVNRRVGFSIVSPPLLFGSPTTFVFLEIVADDSQLLQRQGCVY